MPTAKRTFGMVETVYRLSGWRVGEVCGPLERFESPTAGGPGAWAWDAAGSRNEGLS